MVRQRWCTFKAAFKSWCSFYFQDHLRGLLPTELTALASTGQHSPPTPPQPPPSTSLIVYERLLLLGHIQKQEKTQEPGCAKASKVKGARGRVGGRNSSHSLMVFSRFLKRQLLGRASEVSNRRGNWRERREEENRILEGARHLHTAERHSACVPLPGRSMQQVVQRGLQLSRSRFIVNHRDISF